jgi:hypothetical protein
MSGLESLAKRLEIVRDIVHQNIRDARATTERIKNVNAKHHDFQVGDRVFFSAERDSSRLTNRKHSPAFIGPFVLVELKNNLVKLVHFYTGKPLKNFINMDKLRRLRDESRAVLYNRHKPTQQTFITEDMMMEQRPVQPSSDTNADGAQNSVNPIDTIVKPGNNTPVNQSLERGQNEKDEPVDTTRNGRITEINGKTCPRDQPCNTQALSSERWSDQMAIGQQANRRDLLPSNTVAAKKLLVCRLMRPGG